MEYVVNKDQVDVRLDRLLKKACKDDSLSAIFSAIRKGQVKVNGKKSKENYRLKLGDIVTINSLNFNLEVKEHKMYDNSLVFYEDEDILIINKPKGIAMHKGTDTKRGLAEMFNMDFANRLDKKTSGLVIGCKNPKSLRHMTELIREDKVIKKYRALVRYDGKHNEGESFVIDSPIDGKESKTKFTVTNITDGNMLLDIRLYTGRKHQIRKHLQSIGMSIIGDDKYGNYRKEDKLMLECYYLSFDNKEYEL